MAHNYNLQRPHLFDFGAVMEATTDAVKAATWAMEVGLQEKAMLCPQCAQPMRLNARARYWQCCRKTRHPDGNQEQCSIFVNSWFSKMKLTLPKALRLMIEWCMRAPQSQAAHMAKVSQNTVSDWYAGCRVLCSKEPLNGEFKDDWEIHIKRHIKAIRGMKKDYLDGYLDEYMWRSWFLPARSSPGEYMCGLAQAVIRHPKQEE
ncbi:NADPH-dependent diflavin oxidoreductase 1 [Phytophthora cinnamomi]|uniref:NADPH-dependent diflavin oxidoreductase 1 n=1 Tax=Phytophthora cinnamomi TaxID=4785 RepID=UPI003559B272|nr:NADPH-dependent diflavin oxidoreductase 1 [Phytophthora cinnamomi]